MCSSDLTSKTHYGVNIDAPDVENFGVHFGFFGAKASNQEELRKAFAEGLAALKDGRSAILNVSLVR